MAQRYTKELFAKKMFPRSPALKPRGPRLAQRLRSPSSHGSGHCTLQKLPLPVLSLTACKRAWRVGLELSAPKPALRVSAACVC